IPSRRFFLSGQSRGMSAQRRARFTCSHALRVGRGAFPSLCWHSPLSHFGVVFAPRVGENGLGILTLSLPFSLAFSLALAFSFSLSVALALSLALALPLALALSLALSFSLSLSLSAALSLTLSLALSLTL